MVTEGNDDRYGAPYYVSWYDHCTYSESSWRDMEEVRELKPLLVNTLGYLISEDELSITLLSSLQDDQDKGLGEFVILKGTIKERFELKKA